MALWTVAGAAAAVLFGDVTWPTPWRQILEAFSVALVFTVCIVPIIGITMPRLFPAVHCRVRSPFHWPIVIAVLLVISVIGSTIAIGVLLAAGYVPPAQVQDWFFGSVRISVIMTLIFGVAGTMVEILQTQLQETTVALRTKERDEADAKRAAAEAQLASLESRVNPHFLFNTLNSIAALTHDDPSAAERMTGQLASLMRSALDAESAPLVTLDDELRLVRAYLDIERVRFGDRLRLAIEIDAGVHETPVPRLSLQTIVENSIKFAVSPRREGGAIAIRARADGPVVRIAIEDDGPGFDVAQLPEGHGLALLRARLAILFGDRGSLRLDSAPGRSTVTVRVPAAGSSA